MEGGSDIVQDTGSKTNPPTLPFYFYPLGGYVVSTVVYDQMSPGYRHISLASWLLLGCSKGDD